jgi:hypothetical protein
MKRFALFAILLAAGQSARGQTFPIDVAGVKIGVTGFIQVDATLLDQSAEDELNPATQQPLNTERIDVRRGHVRLDASKGIVGGAFEIDANTVHGSQVRIIAAEVSVDAGGKDPLQVPTLLLSLGLTRIPFGYETLQHDLLRPFLEQSNVNRAFFPGSYAPGLRARGAFRFLRYDVAVMSGQPIDAANFAAQAPTHSVDFIGRIGIETALLPELTFTAGVSGLDGRGFSPGTPSTKDQLVWRDENADGIVQLNEIQVVAGSPGVASGTFRHFAIGGDAHLAWKLPFGLLVAGGELIWAQNLDRALFVSDPINSGRDQRGNGYSVSGVLQDLPYGFAAGVRFDRYDPDADVSDANGGIRVPFDASVSTLAFMASVRLEGVVRLMIEYDRNHNAFGRGPNGEPASLAADSLTARAELAF